LADVSFEPLEADEDELLSPLLDFESDEVLVFSDELDDSLRAFLRDSEG
jgi:hypothetical protein